MLLKLALALLLCSPILSFAQTLTMPPEIQKAYDNGTRSPDGRPGQHYWQNRGQYHISLTINPPNNTITGVEQISYSNNSPDTLKSLNMNPPNDEQ